MKNLKLLLLALITPLLCGVSFATNNYDNLQDYIIATGSFSNVGTNVYVDLHLFDTSVDRSLCMAFSGLASGKYVQWGFQNQLKAPNVIVRATADFPKNSLGLGCSWGNKNHVVGYTTNTTPVDYVLYDFGAFLSATSDNGGGSSCDYSDYESTINTLSGSLATCNSNLNSCLNSNCDTQLNQCLEDKTSCQSSLISLESLNSSLSGSLSSCIEDKTSLQNYNNSLSSQLNECLIGSGDNGSGDFRYSLFWEDDTMYSLPITNNLFLPVGYKGKYNDDNVLSIAKINNIESAYQFNEDDKATVIDIMSIVMLFLLATGLLVGGIAFFKRLFVKK